MPFFRSAASLLLTLSLLIPTGCGGLRDHNKGANGSSPAASSSSAAATPGDPASSPSPGSQSAPASEFPSASTSQPAGSDGSATDLLTARIRSMSLEQKLGQMLIAGVEGTKLDERAQTLITRHYAGGFILYKDNIVSTEQTLELLNGLKETNRKTGGVPLFLSVDHEGGKVNRLPSEFKGLPSSREIAASGSKSRAQAIGKVMAEELRAFGFNLSYAPVLDIDSNPKNPVIGPRSFGSTAKIVETYGVAEMIGLQKGGMVPVVKHFPGHGDTGVDSHLELPVVHKSMKELRQLELMPFSAAVAQGADAVMAAHILLPELDQDYPATLSPAIIGGLLRKELGFNGVVITDDMTMGAIIKHYSLGEAAVQAVKAGCDVVLVAHGYDNAELVLNALKQAVQSDRLDIRRIEESVLRILALKEHYGLKDSTNPALHVEELNASILEALGTK